MYSTLIIIITLWILFVCQSMAVKWCQPGYVYSFTEDTCADADECRTWGACSQLCINEPGTFRCECLHGYEPSTQDRTRCRASTHNATLLVASGSGVKSYSLSNGSATTILTNFSVVALDYSIKTKTIFWDQRGEGIRSSALDQGDTSKLLVQDSEAIIDGMAFDWIHDNLYWTDTKTDRITVLSLQKNFTKVIVSTGLKEPRAIVLDPLGGWMYWTDWGQAPACIERAWMDGSHRRKIVSSGLRWPNGLTIDFALERIFWADAGVDRIESTRYDGSDRRTIMSASANLRHPFGLAVFEDYIYYSDWSLGVVHKADKFTGRQGSNFLTHQLPRANVIEIYHHLRQPDGENRCLKASADCCRYVCMSVPRDESHQGTSCACFNIQTRQFEVVNTTDDYAATVMTERPSETTSLSVFSSSESLEGHSTEETNSARVTPHLDGTTHDPLLNDEVTSSEPIRQVPEPKEPKTFPSSSSHDATVMHRTTASSDASYATESTRREPFEDKEAFDDVVIEQAKTKSDASTTEGEIALLPA